MAQHPTRKRLLCFLTALLLLFVVIGQVSADGGDTPFEQVANGYHVKLVFEEPAKVGSNNIIVQLRSEAGSPVDGADVQIEVLESAAHGESHAEESSSHDDTSMDMGGESHADANHSENMTMPMGNETHTDEHADVQIVKLEMGHESGDYHGSIVLPKSGNWQVSVNFKHQNEENVATFPLTIAAGLPKAGILGGFLSVNLAVIVAAAFLKRKTANAVQAKIAESRQAAVSAASIERNQS